MKISKIFICVLTALLSTLAIAQDTTETTKTESELIREYPFNFIQRNYDPRTASSNPFIRGMPNYKVCVYIEQKVLDHINLNNNSELINIVYRDVSEDLKQKVQTTPPKIHVIQRSGMGISPNDKGIYIFADNDKDAKIIAGNFIEYCSTIYKNYLQTERLPIINNMLEQRKNILKSSEDQLAANNIILEKLPKQLNNLTEKYILPADISIAKNELANLITQNNSLQITTEGLKAKLNNLAIQKRVMEEETDILNIKLSQITNERKSLYTIIREKPDDDKTYSKERIAELTESITKLDEKETLAKNRMAQTFKLLDDLKEIRIKTEIEYAEIEAKAKTLKQYCTDYNEYIKISEQIPVLTIESDELEKKISRIKSDIKSDQNEIEHIKNYNYQQFIEDNGLSEIIIYTRSRT